MSLPVLPITLSPAIHLEETSLFLLFRSVSSVSVSSVSISSSWLFRGSLEGKFIDIKKRHPNFNKGQEFAVYICWKPCTCWVLWHMVCLVGWFARRIAEPFIMAIDPPFKKRAHGSKFFSVIPLAIMFIDECHWPLFPVMLETLSSLAHDTIVSWSCLGLPCGPSPCMP